MPFLRTGGKRDHAARARARAGGGDMFLRMVSSCCGKSWVSNFRDPINFVSWVSNVLHQESIELATFCLSVVPLCH